MSDQRKHTPEILSLHEHSHLRTEIRALGPAEKERGEERADLQRAATRGSHATAPLHRVSSFLKQGAALRMLFLQHMQHLPHQENLRLFSG